MLILHISGQKTLVTQIVMWGNV